MNIEKTIEQGRKITRENKGLDVKYSDLISLFNGKGINENSIEAVRNAYLIGLARGKRNN